MTPEDERMLMRLCVAFIIGALLATAGVIVYLIREGL